MEQQAGGKYSGSWKSERNGGKKEVLKELKQIRSILFIK